MWLGSFRVLYISTALVTGFGLAVAGQNALAQQALGNDQSGQQAHSASANRDQGAAQQNIPSSPPSNQLVAQQAAPAPRIEPMLTPQEMANRAAEAAAQQQMQQQQMMQQQAQQQGQIANQGPNQIPNQGYAQQLAHELAQQQYYQQQAQQQAQQQQPLLQSPEAMMQQMQYMQQMPQQQAPSAGHSMPNPQQAAAQDISITAPPSAAETPQAAPPSAAQATHTSGYAPDAAQARIPSTSGMLPVDAVVTNQGFDMSIDPDLIGGYDPNQPLPELPYEVQLEQRTRELQQQARIMAFEQAKRSALPMETHEIRDVLGRLKDTQEAIQIPVRPAPKPTNVIKTISTDPSATPEIIHLAAGNVSTLNFVDVTGEPWPIVDLGFGGAFDIKPPEAGGHVIRVTPLRDFARGNLVVRLLKMTTPLTFSLHSGGDTVYYRFDARVPDYGPNAKMPVISEGISIFAGDKVTTSFLEGVPPKGAVKLNVAGVDARTTAFRYSGTMYIRTPLSLLSPSWQGSATSSDGMNVYLLQETPVLLLSDKGALVRAHITEHKRVSSGF